MDFEKIPEIRVKKQEKSGEQENVELLMEIYADSELLKKLNLQREKGGKETALFTDIDHTFHKVGREGAMNKLTEEVEKRDVPLITVTGNGFEGLYENRIKSQKLPYFDVIIGAVGTEIWLLHKNENGKKSYVKDEYFEKLLIDSGFDREMLVKKAMDLIIKFKQFMPESRLDFQNSESESLRLSDKSVECQPFKISFYFFSDNQKLEEISKVIVENFPNQSVVICEEINHNSSLPPEEKIKKYCLDILPLSKGDAVNYISKLTGIKQGIVAGDSGNDVDMLLKTGNLNAVLVGGYKKEALEGVNAAIENKKSGRSFQKIAQPDGTIKAIYIEQNPEKRQAPESILRAAEILMRAENIKKIRNAK